MSVADVALWVLFLVLAYGAAVVLIYGPVGARDPGPWRVDGRLLLSSPQCRARSLATEGRCTKRAGHWWGHDRDPWAGDERFVGATAAARGEALAREQAALEGDARGR